MQEASEVAQHAEPSPHPRSRLHVLRTTRREWGAVLLIWGLSRLAFYAAALYGSWALPEAAAEAARVDVGGPAALALHWRFDAIHYYSIAAGGYNFYFDHPMAGNDPSVLHAFFPLLPLLLRGAAAIMSGLRPPAALPITDAQPVVLLAGVLLVHGMALLAFWLLFQLAREETGDVATARRTVLYTAISPLGIFLAIPYTEALFIALTTGCFLAARRGQWLRAGLWAAAASATRLTGVLLLPALVLEMVLAWRRGGLPVPAWGRAIAGLLLAPSGLLLFMLYQWRYLGNAQAFLTAQSFWQRQRLFPLTTLWHGTLFMFPPWSIDAPDLYARNLLQTLFTLGFVAVLLASLRAWRPAYVLYGLLLFGVSLSSPLTGAWTMQSQGRYAMVLFPVYITLARWGRRPSVHQAIVLVSLPLFGLLAALYARWWYVA